MKTRTKAKALSGGFSLPELMVVLLVIAILAAVAYPSYRDAVLKTRRAEGLAALAKLMEQQERYYSVYGHYVAFSADATEPEAQHFKWYSGEAPAASFYEIEGRACDGESLRDCIALSAYPGTARVRAAYRDPRCGTLALDSRGRRSADGARCWP